MNNMLKITAKELQKLIEEYDMGHLNSVDTIYIGKDIFIEFDLSVDFTFVSRGKDEYDEMTICGIPIIRSNSIKNEVIKLKSMLDCEYYTYSQLSHSWNQTDIYNYNLLYSWIGNDYSAKVFKDSLYTTYSRKSNFYSDEIKNVIYNNPATIVYWKDGSKTVVKACKGDKFNPEAGLALCILKKLMGNDNKFHKLFKKYSYTEPLDKIKKCKIKTKKTAKNNKPIK